MKKITIIELVREMAILKASMEMEKNPVKVHYLKKLYNEVRQEMAFIQ